jgi:hypothetical protein
MNNKDVVKMFKIIFIIFFILPFISIFLPVIIEIFSAFNDNNYVVNPENEISYITNHQTIAETLCTSIIKKDFKLIKKDIMPYEKETINYQKWQDIIYYYESNQLNENTPMTCTISAPYSLSNNQIKQLEYEYQINYNQHTRIEDGYTYQVIIKGNTTHVYVIEVIQIDDVWYLYSIK